MNNSALPITSLITANLIILVLAIIEKTSVFDLIIIYWGESVIIGCFTIFKMMKSNKLPATDKEDLLKRINSKSETNMSKKQYILFFTAHYFLFCLGHLFFIFQIFYDSSISSILFNSGIYVLILGGVAFIISHAISFRINYLGKKEYLNYDLKQLMGVPYARVFFIHLFTMGGGWLIKEFGTFSVFIVIVFIAGKIFADFWRHVAEHKSQEKI